MAQQGQSGRNPSGPPGPPPPRPPKTPTGASPQGTPTTDSGDVTPARGPPPPPATKRVSIGVGSTRSAPPPTTDTASPPPTAEKPVRDTGPSTSPRPSLRDPVPSTSDKPSTSARTPVREPGPSSSPSRPVSTRESGRITFQEAAPSTSAKVVKLAASEPRPAKPPAKEGFSLFKRKKKNVGSSTPPSPARRPRAPSVLAASALQNRAKTNRILYTTDEEVRDALVEFSVFIIFLILTSLVVLSVRHTYMFYFNDTMKKLFTNREMVVAPSVTVGFEKLITVPDWWDYLKYNFLVTLHGDLTFMDDAHLNHTTMSPEGGEQSPEEVVGEAPEGSPEIGRLQEGFKYNGNPYIDLRRHGRAKRQMDGSNEDGSEDVSDNYQKDDSENIQPNMTFHHLEGRVFLYENLLLGPPRLRQIRVRKESCYVNDAFIRYFNTCYAAYSSGAEDRKAMHKGSPFRTMNDLDSTPIWTVLAFYRTGGYTVNLDYDKDTNVKIINDLKDSHWLDRGSRLCLVEFNLFNENTDIFQSIKLIAEIPPTGGVIPQAHLQTVKMYSFFTDRSMLMTVIYIFWYIMVIYYTIYEITEIRKSGLKIYFFSMLNILDCAILLGCYLALVYNIWHSFKVMSLTARAHTDVTYQSLDVLCFWNIIYVDMMAILAFLVWIKIFKFISFNKTLVQFTTTLKRCSKDLAGFSLMFGIVFLAYAQLGLLLFGTKHPDFRNFITSILTMIRMILGDFQYNLIEQANRVLGPIYFLTYILLVFFILLNMFLAIIMETYNTVKGEITQGRSHLGSYIYRKLSGMLYWITHCGRKRRPQPQASETEDKDAEHDVGAAHDETHEMRKNMTPAEQQYFKDIPQGDNQEMVRLNNRVGLLEEILEKLINNMDDILKRIEKDHHNKKK
uniref:Polycystic kidney disease 2 protein n=1 Tax=Drosophila simulans TaxID=7240 RepID=A0A223LMX1_DROSI|nr:polycystic kidney disease 2 protein [Drosophila simulans]ASU06177.1 polycystic kidney disease 2 protein [Drosophila simulans]ASU06180.1 polycystic kidney disease 2 protein [Drosophila simulans]ASU06181.1 polycystic kidney disease 2 protein [Drosophila simulans]